MPDQSTFTAAIPELHCEYYTLSGGARMRYAICEPAATPRGTFLIVGGRREFIEKKYIEIGKDLLARGFKIILFDGRGSGLSDRIFEGMRRQYDHFDNFYINIKDLHAFWRDIALPRASGPLFLFSHSLGGLIALRWLAENAGDADAVKAAIFTAPAFAIGVPRFSHAISHLLVRLGRGEHYAAGQHDYDHNDRRFIGNVLSHDPERFAVIEKYFGGKPDLTVGGVTWGWLAATLDAIERLHQNGYLEQVKIPALGLFAGRDIVTPPVKTIPLFKRLPHAEAVVIPGAKHDLMNEADRYRNEALRHMDLFLKRVIRA